jgi:RNA 2',3'-cyclic 3'-phosphodiesterase
VENLVRLFFALWPDAATRARIAESAAALRFDAGTRRMLPENFHVTLAFIGETASARLAAVCEVARRVRAFSGTLCFDAFEYWRGPRVVAAVARGVDAVAQEGMAGIVDLGVQLRRDLSLESEPPRPHVTLARKVMQAPVPQAMSPFEWQARSFSLVCSDTGGKGSVYTVVDTWPLLDKMPKS